VCMCGFVCVHVCVCACGCGCVCVCVCVCSLTNTRETCNVKSKKEMHIQRTYVSVHLFTDMSIHLFLTSL